VLRNEGVIASVETIHLRPVEKEKMQSSMDVVCRKNRLWQRQLKDGDEAIGQKNMCMASRSWDCRVDQ